MSFIPKSQNNYLKRKVEKLKLKYQGIKIFNGVPTTHLDLLYLQDKFFIPNHANKFFFRRTTSHEWVREHLAL